MSTANRTALVQVSGLPPTPTGKTYELWWITKESGPVKAGLFEVQGPGTVIAAPSRHQLANTRCSTQLRLSGRWDEFADGRDVPQRYCWLKPLRNSLGADASTKALTQRVPAIAVCPSRLKAVSCWEPIAKALEKPRLK